MYAYTVLALFILVFIYIRFIKLRKRRSGGKKLRRKKKSSTQYYLKNANKNSNINADPLLQALADDQVLAKGKQRRNHSTNLDRNGDMHFNDRNSCNTSDMSTKYDDKVSQITGYGDVS